MSLVWTSNEGVRTASVRRTGDWFNVMSYARRALVIGFEILTRVRKLVDIFTQICDKILRNIFKKSIGEQIFRRATQLHNKVDRCIFWKETS